jgi:hypothetical protein
MSHQGKQTLRKKMVEEFKQEQASLPADGIEVLLWALSVVFYPSFHHQSPEQ